MKKYGADDCSPLHVPAGEKMIIGRRRDSEESVGLSDGASMFAKPRLRRIDIIGPAGVGKSSLYQHVLRRRLSKSAWSTVSELEIICARQSLRYGQAGWRRLLIKASLAMPKVGLISARYVNRQQETCCFEEFCEDFDRFLEFGIQKACSSGKSAFRKALGFERFVWYLKRWAVFLKWSPSLTVFCDESLTQRMHSILPWSRAGVLASREYCKRMPKPAGVIVISDVAETVVNNIQRRADSGGKLIPGHRGLLSRDIFDVTQIQLEMSTVAGNVLAEMGVPVLRLEGQRGLSRNSKEVERFMSECGWERRGNI